MGKSTEKDIDLLWQLFLEGDDKCFAVIYKNHIQRLLLYGHKLCPDAEIVHDSIQEIFIQLFQKRNQLASGIGNLKAYLFVAVRNSLVKKMVKKRKFEWIEMSEKGDEPLFTVEYCYQDQLIEQEISAEIKEKLTRAVKALPHKQKEIIYLKFEEGMNYQEISDILGISVESARKLLYRSLVSLRSTLSKSSIQSVVLFFLKKV